MLGYVAGGIIFLLLLTPLIALSLVGLILFCRIVQGVLLLVAASLEAMIPEEQKRWAEEGPDEEEMGMIEHEINSGNISLS